MVTLHLAPFHQDLHRAFFVLSDETVRPDHCFDDFLDLFRSFFDGLEVGADADERKTKNLIRPEEHVESHPFPQGVAGRSNHRHIHQPFFQCGEPRSVRPQGDELEIFVRV